MVQILHIQEGALRIMKTLIAEDDYTSRSILETILKKWGYEVVSVSDGNDAWEILQEPEAPHLCLLDWMMPGMDGVDVCKNVRRMKTSVPTYVILLTARNRKNEIVEGLSAGADDYIIKPFDNQELKARIAVGKRVVRLQQELLLQEKMRGVLEMAGTICHEFNQPLQSICGNAELLAAEIERDSPLHHKIRVIREQTERIAVLTRKVMNITTYASVTYSGKTTIVDLDRAAGCLR